MAAITGKVISVGLDVDYPTKDGSRTYKAFILKYMDAQNNVKEIVKPMQGLKFKQDVKTTLQELVAGDTFSGVMEKNAADFLELMALKKGEMSEIDSAAVSHREANNVSNPMRAAVGGKVIGNNYETAEERKVKQRLIVRQATINAAVALKTKGFDDTVALAEQLESWVYRGFE